MGTAIRLKYLRFRPVKFFPMDFHEGLAITLFGLTGRTELAIAFTTMIVIDMHVVLAITICGITSRKRKQTYGAKKNIFHDFFFLK